MISVQPMRWKQFIRWPEYRLLFQVLRSIRTWFCSAYITKTNLSYANFSKVVLEKSELWENRWNGAQIVGATFSSSDLSGGEFFSFDWRAANFTHCDLTNSELGDLDVRSIDLQGVKLDNFQVIHIMERLGITIIGQERCMVYVQLNAHLQTSNKIHIVTLSLSIPPENHPHFPVSSTVLLVRKAAEIRYKAA